ncbi:serine threonine kinase, partial [Fusarium coicis]
MATEIVVALDIGEIARQCAKSFSDIVQNATSPSPPMDAEFLKDQLARFRIWTGNLGVFASGTASADYRLCDDPDIKDIIVKLLQRLAYNLKLALIPDNSPQESDARQEQNYELEYSSDSSLGLSVDDDLHDNNDEIVAHSLLSQNRHMRVIEETISQLYKINSIIKKPELDNEERRVGQWLTREDPNRERELEELKSYISWSLHHRFPRLKGLQFLQDRLVQTVIDRRKRLLYRQAHRIKLESGTHDVFLQAEADSTSKPEPNLEALSNPNLEELITTRVTRQERAVTFVDTEASVVNRKGFSTYAKSAYSNQDEWTTHMASQHAKIWACQAKGHEEYIFQTSTDLEAHLFREHSDILSDDQISLMISKSTRPAPDIFAALMIDDASKGGNTLSACPFCTEPETQVEQFGDGITATFPPESYKRLQCHISGHLESISLESLPPRDNCEDSVPGQCESNVANSQISTEPDNNDNESILLSDVANSQISTEPDDNNESISLCRQLNKCLVSCLDDMEFLPLSAINTKITGKNIKLEIPVRKRGFSSRTLPQTILSQARSVFSILALIQETPAIVDLVRRDNIKDEDLPLARQSMSGDDENILVSPKTGKKFSSFSFWPQKARVRDFLNFQWLVLAPVLSLLGQHISLDPKCPLPLIDCGMKYKGGPNSVLHKCKIHIAHQRLFKNDPEPYVAVKEVIYEEMFEREKENLTLAQSLKHEHLIKLIATYQKGPIFYFIFPWADGGDLRDFWKANDTKARNQELVLWSLRQMLGIVSAISALHGKNMRHGGIKPQKVLHFLKAQDDTIMDSRGRLILADVRVNCQQSTLTYEAPEAQSDQREGKPRGRRYDMWSLGCMFLEFTIWLVFDYSTVRSFRKFRRIRDDPKDAFGSFFVQTSDNLIQIHSAVIEAIGHLRSQPLCRDNTALADLI